MISPTLDANPNQLCVFFVDGSLKKKTVWKVGDMGGCDNPFGCVLIFLSRFTAIFAFPEFKYTRSHEEAGPYEGQEWCRGVMIDSWYFDCVMIIV